MRFLAFRPLVTAGKGLRAGTYDVRNAPGVGGVLGAYGINAGKGAKLTARQIAEKRYGLQPVQNYFRESNQEYEKSYAETQRANRVGTKTSSMAVNLASSADIRGELRRMSVEEIVELKGIKQGIDKLIVELAPTKYSDVMKSPKLLQVEKDRIKTAWDKQFATTADASTALARMSDDERVALGGDILSKSEVFQNLSADDFDNIRSAKLSPTQKSSISIYVRSLHAGTAISPAAPQADIITAAGNPKFKAYYGIP